MWGTQRARRLGLALLLGLLHRGSTAGFASAAPLQPLRSGLQSLLCRAPATPTSAVSDATCDFPTVNRANDGFFRPLFRNLTETPFFRYFRVNLDQTCPFWEDDGRCVVRDCSVCECDPKEVPRPWLEQDAQYKVSPLPDDPFGISLQYGSCVEQRRVEAWRSDRSSELEADLAGERLARVDRSEVADEELQDIMEADMTPMSKWVHDDDLTDPEAAYINLVQNPERFTGYGGPSAHRIWRSIYDENCFEGSEDQGPTCLEKRVFYRLVSGLQSSITTHIAQEYLNQATGVWGTNVDLLTERVLVHKDRTENLYFLYLFLLRAVTKAGPALVAHNYTTGNPLEDEATLSLIQTLVSASNEQGTELSPSFSGEDVPRCCNGFDETAMFAGWGPSAAQDDPLATPKTWWEERSEQTKLRVQLQRKFQNISRIMDCVGCEKCRLWGKVQVLGIGTALKVLFGDAADLRLNRNEIIALINTAHQVSRSVAFVEVARDVEVVERIQRVREGTDGPTVLKGLGVALAWYIVYRLLARVLKRRKRRKAKSA